VGFFRKTYLCGMTFDVVGQTDRYAQHAWVGVREAPAKAWVGVACPIGVWEVPTVAGLGNSSQGTT